MRDDPKPCPFCDEVLDSDPDFSGGLGGDIAVQCHGCSATGPIATIGCRDDEDEPIDLEAEAIELWNRRPEES